VRTAEGREKERPAEASPPEIGAGARVCGGGTLPGTPNFIGGKVPAGTGTA